MVRIRTDPVQIGLAGKLSAGAAIRDSLLLAASGKVTIFAPAQRSVSMAPLATEPFRPGIRVPTVPGFRELDGKLRILRSLENVARRAIEPTGRG